jgi:hypothetical protein
MGARNFFKSLQLQFCNLKEALPQTQFSNILKKNVAPQPQLCSRNFSEVHNLTALLPQFSAYFWP